MYSGVLVFVSDQSLKDFSCYPDAILIGEIHHEIPCWEDFFGLRDVHGIVAQPGSGLGMV
jgi:hypothetical protein